jgi:hypothetical protein
MKNDEAVGGLTRIDTKPQNGLLVHERHETHENINVAADQQFTEQIVL